MYAWASALAARAASCGSGEVYWNWRTLAVPEALTVRWLSSRSPLLPEGPSDFRAKTATGPELAAACSVFMFGVLPLAVAVVVDGVTIELTSTLAWAVY